MRRRLPGLRLYISKYPTSEQAEQAYIYLGDAYAADGQAKPAAIAYATLLQKPLKAINGHRPPEIRAQYCALG